MENDTNVIPVDSKYIQNIIEKYRTVWKGWNGTIASKNCADVDALCSQKRRSLQILPGVSAVLHLWHSHILSVYKHENKRNI